jgi:hypothetical protein
MIRVALIDGPLAADHPALGVRSLLRAGDAAGPEGAHAAAMAAALLAGCPGARIDNLAVFGGGLTTTADCVASALEAAEGAALVLCALGMARADPGMAAVVARLLDAGALVVAAAPARGAPVYPAGFEGVVSVQGDARCGPGDWSRLDLPQARFGACPALPRHPGVAGASVAAAHLAGLAARNLATGAPADEVISALAREAPFQGRESRGLRPQEAPPS